MTEVATVNVTDLPDDAVVLDVREDDEFQAGHAPGAVHVPLDQVPARLADVPELDGPIPVICRAGGRSLRAAQWLESQGFEVVNVTGGMKSWAAAEKAVVAEGDGEPRII